MAALLAVAIWLVLATTSVAAHMEVARAAHGRVARARGPTRVWTHAPEAPPSRADGWRGRWGGRAAGRAPPSRAGAGVDALLAERWGGRARGWPPPTRAVLWMGMAGWIGFVR